MKLIGSLTSPYVRKVRIVLAEKKIDCDLVIESPWTEDSRVPEYNPLGKVPVLLLDDESTLFDSRVIVEYLDTMAPNNRLIPPSGRERVTVKRWEALADGTLDAAVAAFLELKRPERERNKASRETVTRQRGKIDLALRAMANDLGDQAWCHGNAMTLADVAIGTALGYLQFRLPDIAWSEEHPGLARLYDKLMQRPAFADSVPQA